MVVVAAPPARPAASPNATAGGRTEAYARAVVAGEIVAGRLVRLACQRHLDDLEHGHERGLHFDAEEAGRAIRFFEVGLRLAEGEFDGKPFLLALFQAFVVGSVYGWKRADGTRRFRTAYLEMGKGNGKTPLMAGMGLYGLTADGEAGAEIYTAGVTRDQAQYLFNDAVKMAEASPAIRARLDIGAHNIGHPDSHSYMRPVSSEGRSLDQKRVHKALIDEIHEHANDVVVNKMRAGTKGRRNPLIVEATNSGYNRNSICWRHHEYSIKVLEGVIPNDTWFAYVCQLDPCDDHAGAGRPDPDCRACDDWRDPAVWPKANPNLGVSISRQYLEEQVAEAEGMPANQALVQRLNFCVWTDSVTKWLDVGAFVRAAEYSTPTPLPGGRRAWVGLDLASTTDLTAGFFLAPRDDCQIADHAGRCYDLRCRFWLPEANLGRRVARDHVPYDVWQRDGWITLTNGNRQDQEQIVADVIADLALLRAQAVGIDRWNTAWLTPKLQAEGLEVVEVGQGYGSLSAPAKKLEADIATGLIHHDGNPVLAWMVANAVAEQDPAGNIKPSRDKSTEKIDGVAAWCDALFAWANGEVEEDFTSVYEQRESLTV
jgi:phage terminase large subunit-like protein